MTGRRRGGPRRTWPTGARWHTLLWLAAVWVVVPLALALARWPRWWTWIAPEQTPMTWLQSVALVLAAAASLLVAVVQRRVGAASVWVWWALAAGLTALALDERFALHERVRDRVLAPRDITVPFLPWVAPGDFLVLTMGIIGLAALPYVWRAMGPDQAAQSTLAAGVALAVIAVGMDSVDPSTWTVHAERVQQTAEEVIELGSGLALMAAVTIRLLGLLDAHLRPEPADPSWPQA